MRRQLNRSAHLIIVVVVIEIFAALVSASLAVRFHLCWLVCLMPLLLAHLSEAAAATSKFCRGVIIGSARAGTRSLLGPPPDTGCATQHETRRAAAAEEERSGAVLFGCASQLMNELQVRYCHCRHLTAAAAAFELELEPPHPGAAVHGRADRHHCVASLTAVSVCRQLDAERGRGQQQLVPHVRLRRAAAVGDTVGHLHLERERAAQCHAPHAQPRQQARGHTGGDYQISAGRREAEAAGIGDRAQRQWADCDCVWCCTAAAEAGARE
jgi:hypothetical protein